MPEAASPDVPFPLTAVPWDPGWLPPEVRAGTAHPARVHDWPGGRDNAARRRAAGRPARRPPLRRGRAQSVTAPKPPAR
jgi:hypothetical protein